jgi:glycosyltransferase involved in cell wall biosynthesis
MYPVLLSIVIPTFNRVELVSSLVNVFLGLLFDDFELIVVDDGSTDGTVGVLSSIKDNRFSLISVENGERGRARNIGARAAKGWYVSFFDSDDLPKPSYCKLAYQWLKTCDWPDWLILGYEIQADDGSLSHVHTPAPKRHLLDILQSGNPLSPDSIFLRRDLALAHPFLEDRHLAGSEDYELWIRLALSVQAVYHPQVMICTVRQWTGRSVSNITPVKANHQFIAFVTALEAMHWPPALTHYSKRIHAGNCMYFALQASFYPSSKARSCFLLLMALFYDPSLLKTRRPFAVLKHLFLTFR